MVIDDDDLIRLSEDFLPSLQNSDDYYIRPLEKRSRQRQAGFSSWAGKRAGNQMGFSSWAGKRSDRQMAGFSSWAGKRAPFNSWAGKRSGNEVIYHE